MANSIKQLITKLNSLEGKIKRSNDMAKAAGEAFADKLTDNVNAAAVVSDPAKGGANSTGSVLRPTVKGGVATVRWSGNQIHYLEFGTGIVGLGKYPDGAQMAEYNYQPQPYGHRLTTWWILPSEHTTAEGRPVWTEGWVPYAPFYTTQLEARMGTLLSEPVRIALANLIERNL